MMTKGNVKTIKDLNIYYDKVRKIRFNDDIKIIFIKDILYYTIDQKQNTLETYFVKGKIQCTYDKYRSLDDIIKLCKFYFPKCTIKDILSEIIKYEKEKCGNTGIYYSYCSTIRKYNFRGRGYWVNFAKECKTLTMNTQNFLNLDVTFDEIINN